MTKEPAPGPVHATDEDDYFFRRDQELLKKLRTATAEQQRREALEQATGFGDPGLLDELADVGIAVESLAAMSLIPMVLVGWADGGLDMKEQRAILKIAQEKNVAPGSPAHELLTHWLALAPRADLAETWERYTRALVGKLSDDARASLKAEILDQTEAAAKASGGMLGFGSISKTEQKMIDRIESALTP